MHDQYATISDYEVDLSTISNKAFITLSGLHHVPVHVPVRFQIIFHSTHMYLTYTFLVCACVNSKTLFHIYACIDQLTAKKQI